MAHYSQRQPGQMIIKVPFCRYLFGDFVGPDCAHGIEIEVARSARGSNHSTNNKHKLAPTTIGRQN